MSNCVRCEVDVSPVFEMHTSGRVMPSCPKCGGGVDETAVINESVSEQSPAKPQLRSVPKVTEPSLKFEPGPNLVDAMTAELVNVEIEIAHLRKREAYANQLRRMLAAAKAEST